MKDLAGWLLALAVIPTVVLVGVELNRTHAQRVEFMTECSTDMKAYECALQWRQSGN